MPGIVMETVKSSNISSIGYDAGTRKLRVKFLSGVMYEYSDVPAEKWQECSLGGSVGTWLHKEIIGHYACEKVVEVEDV